MSSFPSNQIIVISSASTVDHAVSVCSVVSMLMGPPFRKGRKSKIGWRVSPVALGPPVLIPRILFRGLPAGALPLLWAWGPSSAES